LVLSYAFFLYCCAPHAVLHSFPTRRSSDLMTLRGSLPSMVKDSQSFGSTLIAARPLMRSVRPTPGTRNSSAMRGSRTMLRSESRSEGHTSELQSLRHLVCRLLLEKKKQKID